MNTFNTFQSLSLNNSKKMTILPLNITPNLSNFLGYINVYNVDKTTYNYGFSCSLNQLIANYSNHNILFSPYVTNNIIFFNDSVTPIKWITSSLYQERNSNLMDIFLFQGNISNNTLHTAYGTTADNYKLQAFIYAFNSSYNLLSYITTPIDSTQGAFSLILDTTTLAGNIAHLQWGFIMSGFPVYVTQAGQQGSVIVGN